MRKSITTITIRQLRFNALLYDDRQDLYSSSKQWHKQMYQSGVSRGFITINVELESLTDDTFLEFRE